MSKPVPSLWYANRAEEAAAFYASILAKLDIAVLIKSL